jgi:hypothetical protein
VTRTRTVWLAFGVLGAAGGIVVLEFPSGGLLLLGAALVGIAVKPPRGAALAGLVTGLGGTWTILFLRVKVDCDAFNAQPGQACESPAIEGWIVAGAFVLGIGVLATLLVFRRRLYVSGSGTH